MQPKVLHFFTMYPMDDSLEVALKMVEKKIGCAIKALETEEGDEYAKYLSDAHRMIESIMTELGKHPDHYRD